MSDTGGNEAVLQGGGRTPRHLWDYWRIVWEGRWKLLVVLVATCGVALVGTHFTKKKYRAEALLEVNLSSALVIGSEFERYQSRNYFERDQAFNTEFEKIQSRRMVGLAIEEHAILEKVPALARSSDPVRILQRQLRAGRVPQTNAVKISVTWFDPESAALLANAIATTYMETDKRVRRQEIEERVASISKLVGQRTAERRRMLEYDLERLRTETDIDALFNLTSVAEDESLKGLREEVQSLERERDSLSGQYGAGHPEMRRNQRELGTARSQLREALEAHEAFIVEELKTLGEGGEEAGDSLLSAQQREVQAEATEELLKAAFEQAMLAQTIEAKIKVIDPAIAPIRPVSPRPLLNLALAIVVGMGFGGGLLFFQEYLDVSVKSLEDVEQDIGLNLLAVVPAYKDRPDKVSAEAYQTLRTSVVFASNGRKDNVLLITAAAPREGKTRTVAELARTLAASGDSVLVLDCDLRKPAIARELGVDPRRGLAHYLAGPEGEHWRGFVQKTEDGIDVLPPGPVPPNPLHLLGLERFRELVRELKAAYDWVLLDSPPASSVSDAVVLADLADAVLVVIRHDETDRDVVRRTVQRLRSVGGDVVGAVLNGVDMGKAYNRDYYYGRFYYGSYYGEGDEKPSKRAGKSSAA